MHASTPLFESFFSVKKEDGGAGGRSACMCTRNGRHGDSLACAAANIPRAVTKMVAIIEKYKVTHSRRILFRRLLDYRRNHQSAPKLKGLKGGKTDEK